MEINFVSTALILIALFIVYMSITETRCPMCRGWFVIYVADKKPRYYIYKCRKCDYQWTQASRKLTPLMLLCDVLGIRTTGPGSSVPTNTVDEQ